MTDKFENTTPQDQPRRIRLSDIQKDTDADDCWIVINGTIYDATELIKSHSRGPDIVLTEVARHVIQRLGSQTGLELVDPTKAPLLTDVQRQQAREAMPPVDRMMLLQDFEFWAHRVLSNEGWAYYRSAADLERSYTGSMEALSRYSLRPRMLRDMSNGSITTTWMGFPSEMPIYISPAAMAQLEHPLGEVNLTKAAGEYCIVQGIYIDRIRDKTVKIIDKVDKLGAKAIILTADVGWESKRTMEARIENFKLPQASLGYFMASGGLQDRKLSFEDISWIRKYTKLPIIIKGLLSIEDIELTVKHGAQGVMISNHGGRQADCGPAPIDVLYEVRTHRPDLFDKIDIMIDGGVRTGADVVKLLAMGAKAVGFGRSILYANATHGEAGVKRVLEILRNEIINTMRNIGAATINDLKPEMVGPSGPWVGSNKPSYWKI